MVARSEAQDEPRRDTSTNAVSKESQTLQPNSALYTQASFEGRSFLGKGGEQTRKGGGTGRQWSETRTELSPNFQWWLNLSGKISGRDDAHKPSEEGRTNAGVCLRSKETQQLLCWHSELRIKLGCQWSHTRIETAQVRAAAGSRM